MSEMKNSPFELLTQISAAGARNALPLPNENALADDWLGIGFRLAGQIYVAPMSEVDEVLTLPTYTKVPGVKHWLNGVANIRGRLLSVVDLGAMLGNKPCVTSTKSRVLAIRKDDLYSGVIVDEVLGLQAFSSHDQCEEKVENLNSESFFTGGFKKNGQLWTVCSLHQLVDTAEFFSVSA
jgi:twitching motility protein PilI